LQLQLQAQRHHPSIPKPSHQPQPHELKHTAKLDDATTATALSSSSPTSGLIITVMNALIHDEVLTTFQAMMMRLIARSNHHTAGNNSNTKGS
jgi:hypothetical protein